MPRDLDRPRRIGRLYALALVVAVISACAAGIKQDGKPAPPRKARRVAAAGRTPAPSPSMTATPESPLDATLTPRIIPTLMKLPVPTFEDIFETSPSALETSRPALETSPPAMESPLPAVESPAPGGESAPARPAPTPGAALVPAPPTVRAGTARLERRGDLLVAPTQLGAREVGAFILDLGAGATFIDRRLADELQLAEIIPASTAGDAADGEATIRDLRGLAIAGLGLETNPTFAIDLGGTDAWLGIPLAGVIGFPTLGPAPFTLDFTAGTLTIHDEIGFEPPAGVSAEALRIDQGLPFVEAILENDSRVWLLLDTTSPVAITVWRGFAKQHPGIVHDPPPVAAGAPAPEGAVPGGMKELHALRLLGSEHARITVLVGDGSLPPWRRSSVVGRVGMELLRHLRLTVHPGTERIWIERP